jgi:hypothetical protein
MRLLLAASVCCCLAAVQPVRGEQTFPYRAFINANEVYIRGGPGQSYYPTDKLRIGQEVEVYRHDPGGWYAIRPVEESFSWVSARFLKPGEGNLAVIAEENVAARVGSRFSDIRDVIQVRLHKGEVVELLEGKQAGTGPGAERWCKITPPAGEFRWVFGKYVDPEYPRDGVRRRQKTDSVLAQADGAGPGASAAETASPGPSPRAKHGFVAARTGDVSRAPTTPRSTSPAEFQAELDAIEMELSVMVVEEPTVWTFDSLRMRADALFNQAETAVERGRARVLANKIARFSDLKQRSDAVAALREETERSNRQLAILSPRLHAADQPSEADRRFDGVGKLTEVLSPKIGAPRYALIGDQGEVRCYVTPAPGVSLRSYLGRRVGINGTRGYMPEQRAQHLTARRVSVVEDRVLR